jgi:hypothetical protein
MIIEEDFVKMIRKIRDDSYEKTKDMTRSERRDFHRQEVDEYHRLASEVDVSQYDLDSVLYPESDISEKPRPKRKAILLRVTATEHRHLKADAKKENITVSALIRKRALQ